MRKGEDWRAPDGAHTFPYVYKEMFLQILMDYRSLGDIRTLKEFEIRMLYDGVRQQLKDHQKRVMNNQG